MSKDSTVTVVDVANGSLQIGTIGSRYGRSILQNIDISDPDGMALWNENGEIRGVVTIKTNADVKLGGSGIFKNVVVEDDAKLTIQGTVTNLTVDNCKVTLKEYDGNLSVKKIGNITARGQNAVVMVENKAVSTEDVKLTKDNAKDYLGSDGKFTDATNDSFTAITAAEDEAKAALDKYAAAVKPVTYGGYDAAKLETSDVQKARKAAVDKIAGYKKAEVVTGAAVMADDFNTRLKDIDAELELRGAMKVFIDYVKLDKDHTYVENNDNNDNYVISAIGSMDVTIHGQKSEAKIVCENATNLELKQVSDDYKYYRLVNNKEFPYTASIKVTISCGIYTYSDTVSFKVTK